MFSISLPSWLVAKTLQSVRGQLQGSLCICVYTYTCTYMHTYISFADKARYKTTIWETDTRLRPAKWTMLLCEKDQKVFGEVDLNQCSYLSCLFLFPYALSFLQFIVEWQYIRSLLYLFTYREWATAMVYVKSRRRLQFLSNQPWRCSQAFKVKLLASHCFKYICFSSFLICTLLWRDGEWNSITQFYTSQ